MGARSPVFPTASILRIGTLAALAIFLGSCGPAPDALLPSTVQLLPCRVKGIETDARCGSISVAENREAKVVPTTARRLTIHFAILPAVARSRRSDPVFLFAGGPGQSAIAVAGVLGPLFSKINKTRDLVFIDLRGTGQSHPLNCDIPKQFESLAAQLDAGFVSAQLNACGEKLVAAGEDPSQYITSIAVRDVDDVRQALGYVRLNLWGISYGTRAALEYLRQFPEHVRTVTLDGVAPAWMKVPISFSIDGETALQRLLKDCAADAACQATHPHLAENVNALVTKLTSGPISVTALHPLTGRSESIRITQGALADWLRAPLYAPITSSLLPEAIDRAAQGEYSPLVALELAISSSLGEDLSFGAHLAVICAEDMSQISDADIDSVRATVFGTAFFDSYRRMCASWRVGHPPGAFFEPVHSDVPVLILSGGLDPATPPRWAAEVMRTLPHARQIVAPQLGHGVTAQGCATELIEQFIGSTNANAPDGHCLADLPRPYFFRPITLAAP